MKKRIDLILFERGLFPSKEKAKEAIMEGVIAVNGKKIIKPGHKFNEDVQIEIIGKVMEYVSRAGLKLEKAIQDFSIDFKDKVVMDVGSSTGGFTECSLKYGASKVYAVDVGTNQLHHKLRNNKKVVILENTDFRNISVFLYNDIDILTIDVSFISIKLLAKKISEIMKEGKEVIILIKPQFEVGKEIASKYKGIIKDKREHIRVLREVCACLKLYDLYCHGLIKSPIKGTKGNIEYLGYFKKEIKNKDINITDIVK